MTRFLPDDTWRCTAYWYALHARLLTGDDDMGFLRDLGLHAWHLAGAHGIPYWQVAEGPYWVHTWPEWVWSATADAMAQAAAQYGSWCPAPWQHRDLAGRHDAPGPGYWEAGDY